MGLGGVKLDIAAPWAGRGRKERGKEFDVDGINNIDVFDVDGINNINDYFCG